MVIYIAGSGKIVSSVKILTTVYLQVVVPRVVEHIASIDLAAPAEGWRKYTQMESCGKSRAALRSCGGTFFSALLPRHAREKMDSSRKFI